VKHIVLFGSGNGSNVENIIKYFEHHKDVKVTFVISSKGTAPVVEKALMLDVPVIILGKKAFFGEESFIKFLKNTKTDLIVLAGFLSLLPQELITAFEGKIINIHPALLPKFGGKGMYGKKVHEAVLAAGEKESGISVHYVNEHFDSGEVIFQAKSAIDSNETLESLIEKVHKLEHEHYPRVIEEILVK
jgi:phosphoribosylglycinamide formyltransferase 1